MKVDAHRENLSLKEAAIKSGYIDEKRFDEIVDPRKIVGRNAPGSAKLSQFESLSTNRKPPVSARRI